MISVIVPVYNAEKYLDECVRSILGQSYRDVELILVDDGSTDASPSLCDAYQEMDGRVRALHQENGGVSAARNAGLRAARGEWIGFCDCDDYILPGMYEDMLAAGAGADVIVCTVLDEQADGGVRKVETGQVRCMSGQDALYELMTHMGSRAGHRETIWFSVWNKLYRRPLLEGVRFAPETDSAEDVPVNLAVFAKLGAEAGICYIEKPYYFWRWRGGSQSNLHAPGALLAGARTSALLLGSAAKLPGARQPAGAEAAFRHVYWYYSACGEELARRSGGAGGAYLALREEMRGLLAGMRRQEVARRLPPRWRAAAFLMQKLPGLFSVLWRAYRRVRGRR
jgi:glycosyltransferase involved in cell wall biosynthesis